MLKDLIRAISILLCAMLLAGSMPAEFIQAGIASAEEDILKIQIGIEDSENDEAHASTEVASPEDEFPEADLEDMLVMDAVLEEVPQENADFDLQEILFADHEAEPQASSGTAEEPNAAQDEATDPELEGMQAVQMVLTQSLTGSTLYGSKGTLTENGDLLYYSLEDLLSEHDAKKDKYAEEDVVSTGVFAEISGDDDNHSELLQPVVWYECLDDDCEYGYLLLVSGAAYYENDMPHSYDESGYCKECGHRCSHKRGSFTWYKYAQDTTYEAYDEAWHEATYYYSSEISECNSCYSELSRTDYARPRVETRLEQHQMNDGLACYECGYECPHLHATKISEKGYYTDEEGLTSGSYQDKTYHKVKYATRTYYHCPDCNADYGLKQTNITKKREKHDITVLPEDDFAYGFCEVCFGDFDYSKCSHKSMSFTPNAKETIDYVCIDGQKHYTTIVTYEKAYCSKCKMKCYLESDYREFEDAHRWNEYYQCIDCGASDPYKPVSVIESITLGKTKMKLGKKESCAIEASVFPADTHAVFTYKVTKGSSYVSVDQNGVVTAKKAGGKATVKVTAKNRKGSVSANISVNTYNAPKKVTASPKSLSIRVDGSGKVAGKLPEKSYSAIQFSSSNPSVAIVDPNTGMITPVSVGSCEIILTTFNGCSAKCALTVMPCPTDVTLSANGFVLGLLQREEFTVGMIPENTLGNISVQAIDPSIVSVSIGKDGALGTITGKKVGKTTIVVSTDNGISRSYPAEVLNPPSSASFKLPASKVTVPLEMGSYTIVPQVGPLEMTSYTYSSSDKSVATVNKDGVVKFKKAGKVKITVTTHNRLKKTVTLTIKKNAKKVTLSESSITMCLHDNPKLKINLSPKDCYNEYKTFSRDESICTFGSDGVITPKGAGTTIVGVELYNGKTATCQVTVRPYIQNPSDIKAGSINIPLGKKISLDFAAYLADGTSACSHFKYESMDPSILDVNSKGKITGKIPGTIDIRIIANNGVEAWRPVHIQRIPKSIQVYRKDDPEAKSIKSSITVFTGASFSLAARAGMDEYCEVTWSSKDSGVASVDPATGMVYAAKQGSAKITAKVKNTDVKKTITVKVKNASNASPSELDLAFTHPSSREQYIIHMNSMKLANDIYSFSNAKSTLNKLGFWEVNGEDDIHFANKNCKEGGDTVGYAVASKPILVNGAEETLYVVAVRGTGNHHEWISNFNIAPSGDAQGFRRAADDVAAYLNTLSIDTDNSKIWFCGHSRGAVVANYLAGKWAPDAGFDPLDIYAYTFACPTITSNVSGNCPGIFNYNFAGDLVPMVPFEKEWSLKRYGTTKTVDNFEFNEKLGVLDGEVTRSLMAIPARISRHYYCEKMYPLIRDAFLTDGSKIKAAKVILDLIGKLMSEKQYQSVASALTNWFANNDIDGVIHALGKTHEAETYLQAVKSNYFSVPQ